MAMHPHTVLFALIGFRIVNALTVRTFFQPDEYFQSLEPAWQMAFGRDSGAWITWEWDHQLRSSIHPGLFAVVYCICALVADIFGLSSPWRAELYLAGPKTMQAVAAACTDFYTWKLAQRIYGENSRSAWLSLALTIVSPWQWFCSTRTLSNCLETTLTLVALEFWPWQWIPNSDGKIRTVKKHDINSNQIIRFTLSLSLAAFACILRPTNALIWICLFLPTLFGATTHQKKFLARHVLFCGVVVFIPSVLLDRLYYQVWTLPPLRFLYFNIAQSVAVFYGKNRWDYYLTEGLPLLLTTALPWSVLGLWDTLGGNANRRKGNKTILSTIALTVVVVILTLSTISHKEVRFIYPLLPILHMLAAGPLAAFTIPFSTAKRTVLAILFAANLIIAIYTTQYHQRGVLDVLAYLRQQHERALTGRVGSVSSMGINSTSTVAFLMPCHSTPWRSHLVYPSIDAWALTCEPPLSVPLSERHLYLDEADQFYLSPSAWLKYHMANPQQIGATSCFSNPAPDGPKCLGEGEYKIRGAGDTIEGHGQDDWRAWPEYLVFFAQLEEEMKQLLDGVGAFGNNGYVECWRGFNTHWHDDWRRKGDVVVWCLSN
ncbi:glycosyltransferase family 22 protein [Patellaria atrata CBS 101060]|uniref:Mannosyltransferase n=1 Tax=Patellaria atrata CBS 101060 TaxID=1346257 RepID=A0A9P4VT70_9PEZI|nr:glycosyltransferase family 22 protein [Patellaria atrata CBS 101060]